MKRYLVTGGTGFIGSALVHRLVKDGYTVRVFDNNSRGNAERLKPIQNKIEYIEGDIRNEKQVLGACQDVHGVFHLAYVNGTRFFYEKPDLVLEVAVKGLLNIIQAASQHKVEEFYLASSSEVYQSPPTVPTDETAPLVIPDVLNPRYSYGGGKMISELFTLHVGKKYFKRLMIFRPHNVYGPAMGWEHVIPEFIRKLSVIPRESGESPFSIQGTGEETRSFIYIDDFIEALMCMFHRGEHMQIYHLGTMEEVSMRSLAERISQKMECAIKIVPGDLRAGSTQRRCPDTKKIEALGFVPKVSLNEGLTKTIGWYLKELNHG
ncbi:MAG: NAD-dependent dehydratase [Deltaproteobacteria bacterium RIFCSPHIGHO2_02_FULL_40_11]|nr:MAG: NAD-dependent dehydratase [Deltaproteobacteria bacterium RIFCSPHIGHO2_02_FULL_40_11]